MTLSHYQNIKFGLRFSREIIGNHLVMHAKLLAQHKKWIKDFFLPLRISSVNVTKSSGNCGLVILTQEILNGKFHFLCSVEGALSWHPNISFDWFKADYKKYIIKIFRKNIASRLASKHKELKKFVLTLLF